MAQKDLHLGVVACWLTHRYPLLCHYHPVHAAPPTAGASCGRVMLLPMIVKKEHSLSYNVETDTCTYLGRKIHNMQYTVHPRRSALQPLEIVRLQPLHHRCIIRRIITDHSPGLALQLVLQFDCLKILTRC